MKALELFIYPLKSAAAQKVTSLSISEWGPAGDREWLLVDEAGQFITQRTVPKLSQVVALRDAESLTLGLGKMFVKLSTQKMPSRLLAVKIWGDQVDAGLEPDLYSQALSQFLGVPCKLVRHVPGVSKRDVKSVNADWQPQIRFPDGRPLLIANTKSLEDLNSKLTEPVTMDRFRPNIVFEGLAPFDEDSWLKIKIGQVVFSQPKPCTRCKIVNIDQKTAQSSKDAEPLKTLSTYRRQEKGVVFGSLWIPENAGSIREDDRIEILQTKA